MVTGTASRHTNAKTRTNATIPTRTTAQRMQLAKIPMVVSSAHVNLDSRVMVSHVSLPTVNIKFSRCPSGLKCDVFLNVILGPGAYIDTSNPYTSAQSAVDMPNKGDFAGANGIDLSLFAELEEGKCSIMGYNWVSVENLAAKMKWLQNYQKQASLTALNALMNEFQRLGKAVLVRQGPSCNMAVAGAIDCKLLYFPHSDPRCQLIKRVEKVKISKSDLIR